MEAMFKYDSQKEKAIRDEFEKAMSAEENDRYDSKLSTCWMESPVGTMLAIADDRGLHMLSYAESSTMERKVAIIRKQLNVGLQIGANPVLKSIKAEMSDYFKGKLRTFETPLFPTGTDFQKMVWEELRKVPYGTTVTYAELAARVGKPAAYRAVAQANAQNPLHVVIPCHRIVNSDGGLGGYAAGIDRKQWLLEFEKGNMRKKAKE